MAEGRKSQGRVATSQGRNLPPMVAVDARGVGVVGPRSASFLDFRAVLATHAVVVFVRFCSISSCLVLLFTWFTTLLVVYDH